MRDFILGYIMQIRFICTAHFMHNMNDKLS